VYRDIPVEHAESVEQREVLQRIAQSRNDVDTPQDAAPEVTPPAPGNLLAFVSLARLVSGDAGLDDVLALSSKLIADVMPGSTGAWYLPDPGCDRVTVVQAFGSSAQVLRGASVAIGGGLTGWVAANSHPILNSDPALDLGLRATLANPPLRSCMSVPIVSGSALVAVLSLYADTPDAFTGDQRRLVQMVAPHLAAAIQVAAGRAAAAASKTEPAEKAAGGRDLRLVANRA
jgi:GAF domain-containing protein